MNTNRNFYNTAVTTQVYDVGVAEKRFCKAKTFGARGGPSRRDGVQRTLSGLRLAAFIGGTPYALLWRCFRAGAAKQMRTHDKPIREAHIRPSPAAGANPAYPGALDAKRLADGWAIRFRRRKDSGPRASRPW
jgi:hypothetical protein